MPRAQDYRDGAALLRRHQVVFSDAARSYPSQRIDALASGPIADVHDDALAVVAGHLATGSDALADLARLCDERAEVCAAYAARMLEWWQLPPLERLVTPPPPRPAPWAES